MRATSWKLGLAALAFAALSTSASAAVCTGPGGGNNLIYGEIPEASACDGMFAGNTDNSQITVFGFTWDFLAKQNDNEGPYADALSYTVDANSGGTSGTWTIDLSVFGGLYNSFVIALKPDGGYGYFLVENILTGTWNTDSGNIVNCPTQNNCAGFALSHMSLYGRFDERFLVSEPGTLLLFGLALVGFVATRRRGAAR